MSELIDKEALLDECLNHYEVGNIEQNCTMDWICKTVRNFPTVSPWHRVDEPPDTDEYVHAFDGAFVGMASFDGEKWWQHDTFESFTISPSYWMPLPELPKEIMNE